ncbi:MAG TPA: FxsA family protein [Anaerolineae bacterium]|nr:FxsA family protein [Anaerolineae bacterium]HMR64333.1 FxsA family protein [Anaerolineae bacterium]
MLARLLLLFIVVPAVELFLLIEIGQWIGTLPTIGLIFATGALGAFLAKRQGLQVLTRLQTELQTGRSPADSIFDGVLVLLAGALLLTPGILTDILGFLCLIPATRRLIKQALWSRIEGKIRSGQIFVGTPGRPFTRREPDDVIIIDSDDYKT